MLIICRTLQEHHPRPHSGNPNQLSLIILKQNSLVLQPTLRPEVGKPVSSFRASPQASDKNNSSQFLSNNPPASQFSDIPPTLGDIPEVLRSSCRLQTHVNVCEKPSGKVSPVSSYSVVSTWQREIRTFASAAIFCSCREPTEIEGASHWMKSSNIERMYSIGRTSMSISRKHNHC